MNRSRSLLTILGVLILVLGLIQVVPYGRYHRNPPDGTLATFDTQETRALAERACYDCHSNRTKWPWYASLAPVSWRIQHHVDEGREKLNFTAFDAGSENMADAAGEASESVTKGEMPPADYLLMHPEARLTASEKAALAKGLDVTFAAFAEKGEAVERAEAGEREAGGKDTDRD